MLDPAHIGSPFNGWSNRYTSKNRRYDNIIYREISYNKSTLPD